MNGANGHQTNLMIQSLVLRIDHRSNARVKTNGRGIETKRLRTGATARKHTLTQINKNERTPKHSL